MKKEMKKALPLYLVLAAVAVMVICCFIPNKKEPKYELVEQVQMTSLYNQSLGYTVNIKGKLKNTSGKEFSYVSVTFAIYDENGGQIAIATDSMTYVQAGSIWSFNAKLYDYLKVYPKSCKLVDVVAY